MSFEKPRVNIAVDEALTQHYGKLVEHRAGANGKSRHLCDTRTIWGGACHCRLANHRMVLPSKYSLL